MFNDERRNETQNRFCLRNRYMVTPSYQAFDLAIQDGITMRRSWLIVLRLLLLALQRLEQ